jgi:hypothetical protein
MFLLAVNTTHLMFATIFCGFGLKYAYIFVSRGSYLQLLLETIELLLNIGLTAFHL